MNGYCFECGADILDYKENPYGTSARCINGHYMHPGLVLNDRQSAAFSVMRQDLYEITRNQNQIATYLENLLRAVHDQHFQEASGWKPEKGILEKLIQLDNMIAGLERATKRVEPEKGDLARLIDIKDKRINALQDRADAAEKRADKAEHALEQVLSSTLNKEETELLAMLAEEAGEVIQAVGKILRHGYESRHPDNPQGPTNREMLERELLDLKIVQKFMKRAGHIAQRADFIDEHAAQSRKMRYMKHGPRDPYGRKD